MLSVVIPSLDEPRESLQSTINGLSGGAVSEVIVVDDCSSDPVSVKGAIVIRNPKRMGSAASRAIGIAIAKEPFVLTTDAHVKFRSPGWVKRIIQALSGKLERVLCFACVPTGKSFFKGKLYGGNLTVIGRNGGLDNVLAPKWNTSSPRDGRVQCVMGGAYAFSTDWYRKIGGYEGIIGWCPTELASLSLRTWAAGGECLVDPTIEVEHRFRDDPPFKLDPVFSAYNKIRLGMTVLPLETATLIPTTLGLVPGVDKALAMFSADLKEVYDDRAHMEDLAGGDLGVAMERSGINLKII